MDIINKMIKRETEKFENRAQNEAKRRLEEESQQRELKKKLEEESQQRELKRKLEEESQQRLKEFLKSLKQAKEVSKEKLFLKKLKENTRDMNISHGQESSHEYLMTLRRFNNSHYNRDYYLYDQDDQDDQDDDLYDQDGVLLRFTIDEIYEAQPKDSKYKALTLKKFKEESYDECYKRFLREINDYRKFIRYHKLINNEPPHYMAGYQVKYGSRGGDTIG